MTKTLVTGYPRVGSERELKFWTEDYFRGNLTADELQKNAAQLRLEQWKRQQRQGIDFIPSNDFSFYDGVLDTAYLLGAVPQRYRELGFNELDTCFAMARGYQGKSGDVKALSMRKWFNTNYHYMVPQLDEKTQLRLSGSKPFEHYSQALAEGIHTVPVILGPFTFLKLAQYKANRQPHDFADEITSAYKDILERFDKLGCEWIQIDEPSLVTDLTKQDIALFVKLYQKIHSFKGNVKLRLQTYFGDIRDIFKELINLGFDGIGLDFVEGRQSLELIEKHGFPKQTVLAAGIVNGKNIWHNDYKQSLELLGRLSSYTDKKNIVISTSCSLLHVPYTIENETEMQQIQKRRFAFAHEKLQELCDLQRIFDEGDFYKDSVYIQNTVLMREKLGTDEEIRKKTSALIQNDFVREPAFAKRAKIQKQALELPLLPTTTIGSFPQTREVKAWRSALKKGEISKQAYEQKLRSKTASCIDEQERLGLDVLVHGEYERNDMVEYFGERLDGFLFTRKGWVQSYGTRCVKPPVIWSDIRRTAPITIDIITYAQSLTQKPVKGMLTGPATILNWSFPREDISGREMAFQIALAIREEVLELEKAGIRIIQIDEAALKEKLPLRRSDWYSDYLSWVIPAFRLVHSGVKPETQIHTHMCYSEFEDIIEDIEDMDADVITFEAARSDLCIVDALKKANFKTQVGPGVYDIHSPRVPSKKEIEELITKMLKRIDKKKLWVNPDCGLKTRGEKEVMQSLQNMVDAAQSVRETLR